MTVRTISNMVIKSASVRADNRKLNSDGRKKGVMVRCSKGILIIKLPVRAVFNRVS